jgi:hypothetical protein
MRRWLFALWAAALALAPSPTPAQVGTGLAFVAPGSGLTISSVSVTTAPQAEGPYAGGTTLHLVGTGFSGTNLTHVFVGGSSCGSISIGSATTATCTTSTGPSIDGGSVAVMVSGPGHSASLSNAFFYYPLGVLEAWDANANLATALSVVSTWGGEFGALTLAPGSCSVSPGTTASWSGSLTAVTSTGTQCLKTTSNVAYAGAAGVTVVMVASMASSGSPQAWFATSSTGSISAGERGFGVTQGSNVYVGVFDASGVYNEGHANLSYTAPHLYTFTYAFNNLGGSLAVTARYDRTTETLTVDQTDSTTSLSSNPLILFAFDVLSGSPNDPANGSIGYFAVSNNILDATGISNIENRERTRWGTP